MEVRERQKQRSVAREAFGDVMRDRAVAWPQAGIDDERGAVANDHADVRDKRHAAIGNHKHAVGDFDRTSVNDGQCGRRV